MNDWYIDRSKNFVEDSLKETLKIIKESTNNGDSAETLNNKLEASGKIAAGNVAAALVRFRDHGLIRMDNTLGDSATLYLQDDLTFGELVIDLLIKRFAEKGKYTVVRPFIIICKVLSSMMQMGIDEDDIFITFSECKEYLLNIERYEDVTNDLADSIISGRTYDNNGAYIPHVTFAQNEESSFAILFNALRQTPLFMPVGERSFLRPNIKQSAFFKYIDQNSDEFNPVEINNNNDLFNYYCDRQYGFSQIIPDIVLPNVEIDDADIPLLTQYLFGYNQDSKLDINKYLNKECFGVFFSFISIPGIPLAKVRDVNTDIAAKLLAYIRSNYKKYKNALDLKLFACQNGQTVAKELSMKDAFSLWLSAQEKADGSKYSKNYTRNILDSLSKVKTEFGVKDVFLIEDVEEFDLLVKEIKSRPNFDDFHKKCGNGALNPALEFYHVFLQNESAVSSKVSIVKFTPASSVSPRQDIYYGVPGTGKSKCINDIIDIAYNEDEKNIQDHSYRVVFYSDYTYGDFVGYLQPKREAKGLDYPFVPGPFTLMLEQCLIKKSEPFFLVIEEINRGNAAAIFGDIFQLLDRDELTGRSCYTITNSEVAQYLMKNPDIKKDTDIMKKLATDRIWLPSNYNILATMNMADQNVFSLDSAFTRRLSKVYVPIDFSAIPSDSMLREELPLFSGTKPLDNMFKAGLVNTSIFNNKNQDNIGRNWPTFAKIVNCIIDEINEEYGSEQIPEDKKLGPFFVTAKDLSSRAAFINKVISYLKLDVFKYENHYFNDSFEKIYREYANSKKDIFKLLLKNSEEVYEEVAEASNESISND